MKYDDSADAMKGAEYLQACLDKDAEHEAKTKKKKRRCMERNNGEEWAAGRRVLPKVGLLVTLAVLFFCRHRGGGGVSVSASSVRSDSICHTGLIRCLQHV